VGSNPTLSAINQILMDIGKTLYVTSRREWRAWLARNHDKEKDIWLVYYRKETGKPRISYNDAVEEALCYGWIDSTQKKLDDERFAQRFSVRRKNSNLSQANRERIIKLIAQKKMTQAGLDAIAHVFEPEKGSTEDFVIPPDIMEPLKANKTAWENFQQFPAAYQRIRIAYIDSRRQHGQDMFEKSLNHFISMTAGNKRIGFMQEK
jgi:uncharacterized protein YdeI (YjbR/CyaY-like superfamily)